MKNVYDILTEKELIYVLPEEYTAKGCPDDVLASAVIVVNLYYPDSLEFYFGYIDQIPEGIDVYIVSSNSSAEGEILRYINGKKNRHYLKKQNRGRDVSAFLVTAREIVLRYKYVCFVHDKKPNFDYLAEDIEFWVRNLWDNTLKSGQYICNVLGLLEKREDIGLLVPPKPIGDYMSDWYTEAWYDDFEVVGQLCERLGLECDLDMGKPVITLGTVFWGRTRIFPKLFSMEWQYKDFPDEPMPVDGTISHGLERLLAYAAQDAGMLTGVVMCDSYAASLYVKVQEMMRMTYGCLEKNFCIGQFDQLAKYEQQKKRTSEAFHNKKNVYLYGAGKYGRRFLKMIRMWGYSPKGFLVSDGYKEKDFIEGYPVWELNELEDADAIIIITTNYDRHMELEKNLRKYGISDYFISC